MMSLAALVMEFQSAIDDPKSGGHGPRWSDGKVRGPNLAVVRPGYARIFDATTVIEALP